MLCRSCLPRVPVACTSLVMLLLVRTSIRTGYRLLCPKLRRCRSERRGHAFNRSRRNGLAACPCKADPRRCVRGHCSFMRVARSRASAARLELRSAGRHSPFHAIAPPFYLSPVSAPIFTCTFQTSNSASTLSLYSREMIVYNYTVWKMSQLQCLKNVVVSPRTSGG